MPKYFLRLTILLAIVTLTASSLPPSLVSAWANDDIQISYEPISLHDYQVDFAAKTMPLRSSVQYRDTTGERKTAPNAPILEGASFRLAYIEAIDRWAYAPLGESLYIVTSLKGEYSPQVLPDSDRLIHKVSGSFGNDTVYYSQDFPKIILSNKSDSGMVLSYYPDYNKMTPMLPYADDNGALKNAYVYRGQAFSRNQRFSIHWMDQSDFIRYDWLTNEAVAFAHWPSFRINPNNLSASGITDDGRYAFINNGEQIYEITSSCGYKIDRLKFKGHITNSYINCPSTTIGVQDYIGKQPPYSDLYIAPGEQQASFYVKDYLHPVEGMGFRFTLTSADAKTTPDKLTYLALGDSYSSGEGDIDRDAKGNEFYINGTGVQDGCHISSRSYPFLLRTNWGLNQENMNTVACSGALIIPDMNSPVDSYAGQHKELSALKDSRQEKIDQSLDEYRPGIVPQIEFVKKYKPDIITLTGGGNDVGFGEVLAYCAGDILQLLIPIKDCGYVEGGPLHDILNDTIDSQYANIRDLINAIKQTSPTTRIYYVGYPSFIAGGLSKCALNSGALSSNERDMINQAVTRLNGIIKKATEATGIAYIDVEKSLYGGRLCEGSEYVTGVWDVGVFDNKRRAQSFHPNARGHQKIAEAFKQNIQNPDKDYQPSQPRVVTVKPGKKTNRARIVRDDSVPGGEMLNIDLVPGSTAGASDIFVATFSEQTNLGTYKSNSDGSFHASIKLPSNIAPGQHLLLLDIIDSDGQASRLFDYYFVSPIDTPQNLAQPSNKITTNPTPAHQDTTGITPRATDLDSTPGDYMASKDSSSSDSPQKINLPEQARPSSVKSQQSTRAVGYFTYLTIGVLLIVSTIIGSQTWANRRRQKRKQKPRK